ncbi:MAG: HDOD domain-containing protein [Actinomycetota bacterium]
MALCFVGRRPIFDDGAEVIAYELLQAGNVEAAPQTNSTVASSRLVIDAFLEIGIDRLAGAKPVVVEIDRNLLLNPDHLTALSPDHVILQIPSELAIDDDVLTAARALGMSGYELSLCDVWEESPLLALLDQTRYLKVDSERLGVDRVAALTRSLQGDERSIVATSVATREEQQALAAVGVERFQGEYLSTPNNMAGMRMPYNRTATLQLVSEISKPDLTADELARLVSTDASLSLRTLRFVNSPLSGLSTKVESIKHAVVLLGRDMIKSWAMLLALSGLSDSVPELVSNALVRARFCELIAIETRLPDADSYFTVGLFSLMDAIAGTTMDDLLAVLPFTDEVEAALRTRDGHRGLLLACAEAYEQGRPHTVVLKSISPQRLNDLYIQALGGVVEAEGVAAGQQA